MSDTGKNLDPETAQYLAELARLRHIERSVLGLISSWSEEAGTWLARANRLGPGKAGEVAATEAGTLRGCVRQLEAIMARDFLAELAENERQETPR